MGCRWWHGVLMCLLTLPGLYWKG